MRKFLATTVAATTLAAIALPATAGTAVTLTVIADASLLVITEPVAAVLAGTSGATVSGALGVTTVADTRLRTVTAGANAWSVAVALSDDLTGTVSTTSLAASAVKVCLDPTNVVTVTTTEILTATTGVSLTAANNCTTGVAFSGVGTSVGLVNAAHTSTVAANTGVFIPTISVDLTGAVADSYLGTVIQSVS